MSRMITSRHDRLQLLQLGTCIDSRICLKRFLCVVFAVGVLFVMTLSPCAKTYKTDGILEKAPSVFFTDVDADMWYAEAVAYGVKAGYFYGVAPNTFGGELSLNRAMMVTLLWRHAGCPDVQNTVMPFEDVQSEAWYAPAVLWAFEENVIGDFEQEEKPALFDPMQPLSRWETLDMIYRYMEQSGENVAAEGDLLVFPDASSVSSTAWGVCSWAYGNDILCGSDGLILANETASRAQAAALLQRLDTYLQLEIPSAYHNGANGSQLRYEFFEPTVGSAQGEASFYTVTAGTYDICWGTQTGCIDATPLMTLQAQERQWGTVSTDAIGAHLAIPPKATHLVAVNEAGQPVAYAAIPQEHLLKQQTGFVFGVLSDIHLPAKTATGEMTQEAQFVLDAMEHLVSQGAQLIAISGDLTEYGYQDEYAAYRQLLDTFSQRHPDIPVYACTGNHDVSNDGAEFYEGAGDDAVALWEAATADSVYYTGGLQREHVDRWMDFTVDIGDCSFIFFNQVRWDYRSMGEPLFTEEQLCWLQERLEEKRDKKVFFFFHSFLKGYSGDVINGFASYGLRLDPEIRADAQTLQTLLASYPNTVYFNGHSHFVFDCDQIPDLRALCYANRETMVCRPETGAIYVHVPSATQPRTLEPFGTALKELDMTLGEGYLICVTEDTMYLRGVAFSQPNTWLGAHHYMVPLPNIEQTDPATDDTGDTGAE